MPTATPAAFRDRLHGAVSAAVGRPLFWAVVVALIAAWPIAWALRTPLPRLQPVLGTVSQFELIAQDGRPFGSKDLAGRVWLASSFFTRCETVCPEITRQIARIQGRTRNLEPAFHLVSISVDPEFDDPARLADYARAHRASPRMWTFLTGPVDAVRETVVRGLRVSTGQDPVRPGGDGISHATQLVLVDGQGRIRGYYDPAEADTVERVVRDAALLVNRG
jgi:protein SCO1/2